jgi:hypothetical protein
MFRRQRQVMGVSFVSGFADSCSILRGGVGKGIADGRSGLISALRGFVSCGLRGRGARRGIGSLCFPLLGHYRARRC